jgi:cytochrome b561
MVRHLKRPNIASVIAHWMAAWAIILALYFGSSAVYGNGSRQETFAAHAYAGLTVFGLVVIRLFLRTLLRRPEEKHGGSRIPHLVAEALHWALYALLRHLRSRPRDCVTGGPSIPDWLEESAKYLT